MISDEVAEMARAIHDAGPDRDVCWPDVPKAQSAHITAQAHVLANIPGVPDIFRDAERLRNLTARFEEAPYLRYSGWQIAAILRGDGA